MISGEAGFGRCFFALGGFWLINNGDEIVEPAIIFGEANWEGATDVGDDFAMVAAVKILNKYFVRIAVP